MSKDIWGKPKSLHFTASNLRWLYSAEKRCAALEIETENDSSVVVTLPEGFSRALRELVRQAFEVYPVMDDWGAPPPK